MSKKEISKHFLSSSSIAIKDPQKMNFSEQETLEEAFQKVANSDDFINGTLFGSQWEKERMYSEEEIQSLVKIIKWYDDHSDVRPNNTPDIDERIGDISMWDWFKQFKNK